MKQLIEVLLLCAVSISIAAASEEMKPGKEAVGFGDGYVAEFVLPDIGKSYQLEASYDNGEPINSFSILADGKQLISFYMQRIRGRITGLDGGVFEYSVLGPMIIMPKTISDAPGRVVIDLKAGKTALNTSNIELAYFQFYPGAKKESDGWKDGNFVEVSTESPHPSPQALQVLESMLESIKVSGPGI